VPVGTSGQSSVLAAVVIVVAAVVLATVLLALRRALDLRAARPYLPADDRPPAGLGRLVLGSDRQDCGLEAPAEEQGQEAGEEEAGQALRGARCGKGHVAVPEVRSTPGGGRAGRSGIGDEPFLCDARAPRMVPAALASCRRRVGLGWRSEAMHDPREIGVRRRGENLERLCHVRDPAVGTNHEQRSVVQFVLGVVGRIHLPHFAAAVAREENGEILVTRPRCERGVGVDADSDYLDIAAVIEERGVLITVRLHLNRSAFCSRLVEKGEDDGAPTVVGESDRRLEQSVPVGAGEGEMVLIVQGSSARMTPETEKLPVDCTIIGIVDSVNVENKNLDLRA